MRIQCAISGIEFKVDHFPGEFYSPSVFHPIFHLPQKRLLSYTGKWAGGELTPTDTYLLFLAILHSSEHVHFRSPVFRTEFTDSIIANNMEFLVRTVIKLNSVVNPAVAFPQFVVSPETCSLSNVHHWIEAWAVAYKEFQDGYRSAHESAKLIRRESALERLIKSPHKKPHEYAGQIAEWAATAGSFPSFLIPSPFTGIKIPISEYWKIIIQKVSRSESLFAIPSSDLRELLNHCEEHIPFGSIYSNALFKILRHAVEKQSNFLGLGDQDLTTSYTILSSSDTVEAANLKALIDSAPAEEPRPEQYENKLQFLRAKMRWTLAQKSKK
jgi:hypothetical protein